MAIKIDTKAVVSIASEIDSVNDRMRSDFDALEKKIKSLDSSWNGTASDKGIGAFNTIKKNYDDNRYLVINNLTTFMKKQVGEGYEQLEKAITDAAAAFK